MKILLKNRELSAFLAILALFAVLVALNPSYLSLQTLGMIFASSQILILLAIGAALVMLTRNIDVSVGSTVGLSAIAVGVALNSGYSLPVSFLFALSIGALAGAFNGFLVVGLRIPAIVATLGTLGLYRGAMLLWTGGKWIEGLPPGLKSLSEPAAVGISPLGMLVLIIAAIGAWTLSRTAFGRDFYAVGDNLAAARQLGVAVNRTRMIAFTLNGMLAACAGIVFASQIGFVPNQTGSGLEMKAIAACVLGGISLLGGTGTLVGAFLGAFFLTQIDTVLVLFRLPAWWNDFIAGLVLLGVLVLDGRLRQALSRHQRALLLSGMAGATGYEGIGGFPDSFTTFANLTVVGLPIPLVLFAVITAFFWLITHRGRFGRHLFLIGQNPRAARYAALSVNGMPYALYGLVGVASAVAALVMVSYFGSARSDLGRDLLMPALTAAVLGGANIYGGSGSVVGTALAALLVGYLQQGLQMVGIPNQVSSALSGALLVVVVMGRSLSLHREWVRSLFRKLSGA